MDFQLKARMCVTLAMSHITTGDQDALRALLHPESDVGQHQHQPHWWFAATAEAFSATPVQGGWLIQVGDPYAHDPEATLVLFSTAFVNVLKWAHGLDIEWVRLDRDAAPTFALPLA